MKHFNIIATLLLSANCFAVSYDPAVHGNPIVVTEGTIEIDGANTVIDGKGSQRCATLGPNVTLKNFVFRNGKSDWGGGVFGGKLVNCKMENCSASLAAGAYGSELKSCIIVGCQADESGSALGNCVATDCVISNNTRKASSTRIATYGGVVYGSTLTNCKIVGNHVSYGNDAPIFGAVGHEIKLTGCQIYDNVIDGNADVIYGTLFSSSSGDVTRGDNKFPTSGDEYYYESTITDKTPPPPPPPPGPTPGPEPTPGPVPSVDPFVGGASYVGWLEKDGKVVGTITVTAAKASAKGVSKVTVAVTPLGGKKKTVKLESPVGGVVTNGTTGLVLAGSTVSGNLTVGGVSLGSVTAINDPLKSKDLDIKKAAKENIPSGTWTFISEDGVALSAAVTAKTGKTKFTGYLDDGTKISVSATGVFGSDDKLLYIPVSYAKKSYTLAFVMVIPTEGEAYLKGAREQPKRLIGLTSGKYVFETPDPLPKPEPEKESSFLEYVQGYQVSPNGQILDVSNNKIGTRKTVGSVAISAGVPYVKHTATQVPDNLSSLKLKYTVKTGVLTGSFKLHRVDERDRIKKTTVNVYGVNVGGVFHGFAVIKKKPSFGIAFGPEE